jgi:hypothetical protein
MKIVDIANEIYSDIGSPTSTSIPAIAFYIRGQVGKINNLLYENFYIEETSGQYEIFDDSAAEISIDAVAIMKKIYEIYDLDVQIRAQMNALASDTILEFTEVDGSSFRRTNRNEISKTLSSMKKDELQVLKDMVNAYRIHKAVPAQVAGDDTVEGIFDPNTSFRRTNLIG